MSTAGEGFFGLQQIVLPVRHVSVLGVVLIEERVAFDGPSEITDQVVHSLTVDPESRQDDYQPSRRWPGFRPPQMEQGALREVKSHFGGFFPERLDFRFTSFMDGRLEVVTNHLERLFHTRQEMETGAQDLVLSNRLAHRVMEHAERKLTLDPQQAANSVGLAGATGLQFP